MEERKSLSDNDIAFLHDKYKEVKPTEKQLKYLKDLGYDEKVKTKFEASELISKLKAKKQQGGVHPEWWSPLYMIENRKEYNRSWYND